MQKRLIIVGGFGSYPEKNWFPWLKGQLEARGVTVEVPQMPDSLHPRYEKWVPFLQQVAGKVDENTYLIGHSLGGTTSLHFLQNLSADQSVGGLILVASPVKPMIVEELRQLDHFFDMPFEYEAIKEKAHGNIIAIYSTNDHRVPIESGHIVKEKLNPKYIEIPEGGHLNEKSGYTEFPVLLTETFELLGLATK